MSMSLLASCRHSRPSSAPPATSRCRARTVPCAVCARLSALASCATSSRVTQEFSKMAHAGLRGRASQAERVAVRMQVAAVRVVQRAGVTLAGDDGRAARRAR